MDSQETEYAGFWIRTAAALIDSALLACLTFPILIHLYGWQYLNPMKTGLIAGPADFVLSWLAPSIAVLIFWHHRQATPGKMMLSLRIVDASTGAPMTPKQIIVRYFAYVASIVPLCLGLFWIAFDLRKQAWHDKLANTVVVRTPRGVKPVKFDQG